MPWFNRIDCAVVQQERLCHGSTGTTVPWFNRNDCALVQQERLCPGGGEGRWRGLGAVLEKGGGGVLGAVLEKGGVGV